MKVAVVAMVLCASLGACSRGPAPEPPDVAGDGVSLPSPAIEQGQSRKKSAGSSGGKVSGGFKTSDEGEPAKGSGSGAGPGGGRAVTSRRSTLPPAGEHLFSQRGWEEYCQAASCDRTDLPGELTSTIERSSKRSFSSRARSGSNEQTISYRLESDRLVMEEIANHSAYRGFSYETIVTPEPGIVSLRLPVEPGMSWSGNWKDKRGGTNGSYSVRVIEGLAASHRGSEEKAYKVELKLFFKGEIEGFTTVVATVAERDLMVLATVGRTEATTQFGTYRSEFATAYRG